MSDFFKYNISSNEAVKYDQGLRAYMLGIYNYMAFALFITGIVAFFAGNSEAFASMLYTRGGNGQMAMSGLGWLIMLAPIGFVMALSNLSRMSKQTTQVVFYGFAVVMGLSLSSIFLVYTSESIARTFFISASTFGAASIYGYATKKDLTSFGSFLFMGLIGIIMASLVNMFLHSSGMQFAISLIGVLLFTGLTAYDTQVLKSIYYSHHISNEDDAQKICISGALRLYLDFINLFTSLLQLMGSRKN